MMPDMIQFLKHLPPGRYLLVECMLSIILPAQQITNSKMAADKTGNYLYMGDAPLLDLINMPHVH